MHTDARMRAVLFDLDGTLIDTRALYGEAYRRAFAAEQDLPSFGELTARAPSSERFFLLDWLGEERGRRVHERMCEAYDALAAELLGGFYEGVPELLTDLHARGVRMGVVTGKSRRAFAATCRCLDLERFFEVVVLEDDVPAPKPDPHGLRSAIAALAIEARESVYVGDTPMDLEAAERAGMTGASALWSRAPDDRARVAAELDASVWALHHPSDLRARLAR